MRGVLLLHHRSLFPFLLTSLCCTRMSHAFLCMTHLILIPVLCPVRRSLREIAQLLLVLAKSLAVYIRMSLLPRALHGPMPLALTWLHLTWPLAFTTSMLPSTLLNETRSRFPLTTKHSPRWNRAVRILTGKEAPTMTSWIPEKLRAPRIKVPWVCGHSGLNLTGSRVLLRLSIITRRVQVSRLLMASNPRQPLDLSRLNRLFPRRQHFHPCPAFHLLPFHLSRHHHLIMPFLLLLSHLPRA